MEHKRSKLKLATVSDYKELFIVLTSNEIRGKHEIITKLRVWQKQTKKCMMGLSNLKNEWKLYPWLNMNSVPKISICKDLVCRVEAFDKSIDMLLGFWCVHLEIIMRLRFFFFYACIHAWDITSATTNFFLIRDPNPWGCLILDLNS